MLGGHLQREERLLSRTRVYVNGIGAFDDMSEASPSPNSGTTGVAHEPRLGRPDSASTC
jgi:hypothetical protein